MITKNVGNVLSIKQEYSKTDTKEAYMFAIHQSSMWNTMFLDEKCLNKGSNEFLFVFFGHLYFQVNYEIFSL